MLDDLLRAVASGERFETKVELTDERGRPVRLMLTGARLPQRSELYLVWLPTPPDAAGRTVLGEGTRPLAGLTRESFYELSVDVDCRLRLVWADPRLAELTGYTLDELHELGGFFGLVAEADRAELQRRNQRLLAGQQVVVRYKLKRKDGAPVCVRDTARPEWGPDGEVVRILGAVVDLSAERAEAPVLQIVEREAQLVAAALDAFVVLLDAQGRIRWTGGTVGNGLAERLRDNVGQNLAALLPGQALLVWLDWLEEAAERKAPVRFRFTWTEDEGGVGRTPAPASGLAEAPARRFDDATAPGGGRELEVLMTAMGEDTRPGRPARGRRAPAPRPRGLGPVGPAQFPARAAAAARPGLADRHRERRLRAPGRPGAGRAGRHAGAGAGGDAGPARHGRRGAHPGPRQARDDGLDRHPLPRPRR